MQILDVMDHVRALSDRMASLCASTRKAIDVAIQAGDQGTGDLYIEVVRDLDKQLWFVEARKLTSIAERREGPWPERGNRSGCSP